MSDVAPRPEPPVVDAPEGLTPPWLSAALSRDGHHAQVDHVRLEPVGSGQIGSCYRLRLRGRGVPASLVAKLPVADAAAREMLAGAYRSEIRFYQRIARTVAVAAPTCHYAAMDEHTAGFTLLLEDLSDARVGDQLDGCTPADAHAAVANLADLHGPRWCDPSLVDDDGLVPVDADQAAALGEVYGSAVAAFLERLGERLAADDRRTLRATVDVIADWSLARGECFAPVHGDYRLDNLLFASASGRDGARAGAVAVDWQTLSVGLPARDLAFLLGTGLTVADRRAHEQDLVAAYHRGLVEHGVVDHPREQCWDDYRLAMLQGPLITVLGCAYGTRTPRGDDMFTVMAQRACAAIRDLGTLGLVGTLGAPARQGLGA